jgi:hypothetical protein
MTGDIKSKLEARTPETSLPHVAQTIVLAGFTDPRRSYRSKDLNLNLNLPFTQLLKTNKCNHPFPQPQLALPAHAIWYITKHYYSKHILWATALADLITIALFILLCLGDYAMPTSRLKTPTVQFHR